MNNKGELIFLFVLFMVERGSHESTSNADARGMLFPLQLASICDLPLIIYLCIHHTHMNCLLNIFFVKSPVTFIVRPKQLLVTRHSYCVHSIRGGKDIATVNRHMKPLEHVRPRSSRRGNTYSVRVSAGISSLSQR